jgi:glycosyltransferase involved in cell wall biosynthesis
MKTLPTLDVVIPAFNEAAEIADCLSRLLVQKTDIHQIIVVDNASTDATARIVQKIAAKNPGKIKLIHESKPGVENARNTGFAAATADLIGRIDADTHVSPHWANAVREFLSENPKLSGCSGTTIYYDLPWRRLTNFFGWLTVFFINEVVGNNYSFYGANMAIRRQIWEEIKPTVKTEKDGKIMEDVAVSIAVNLHGYKVGWAKTMLADVSGRRMRTSPLSFARYSARWWRTYWVYGRKLQAVLTRLCCWGGNVIMTFYSTLIRFHDPLTMTWHLKHWRQGYESRGFQTEKNRFSTPKKSPKKP